MAKIKLKRPGSSLDSISNTKTGGATPVYPSYLNAPKSKQSTRANNIDDAAYKRNLTPNIQPSDTIHYNRQAKDLSTYKAVAKRGSGYDQLNKKLGMAPNVLQSGRSQYLTEDDDAAAVKNYTMPGKRSKAKR